MIEFLVGPILAIRRQFVAGRIPQDLTEEQARAWVARRREQASLDRKYWIALLGHVGLFLGSLLGRGNRDSPPFFSSEAPSLPKVLFLVSLALGVGACAWGAHSKGRSALWGLFGFAPLFGPLYLMLIGRLCIRCGRHEEAHAIRCGNRGCGGPV